MRVIAGQARGLRLAAPRGRQVRPTSDRVRESLFNILGARVPGADVLDLFAGSGSVGVEALSRGARAAVFVELDPHAVAAIRRNLAHTGQAAAGEVRLQHSLVAVRQLGRQGRRFSVIFMDPPYGRNWPRLTLKVIAGSRILAPGGVAVVEHGRREVPPQQVEDLQLTRQNNYGDTTLSFYEAGDRGGEDL
ncbi:MAG: 16S rRNA (guanine(966)-N(2))-methyltransferase RsmD [bacterium]|nr:16S rRNA (guanine(966)-N(2))-methyltransferase RsmD [bacterium]